MEQKITRTQVIIVDTVAPNQYGDLTFTDKEGNSYKVSNKRVQYFEKVIQPDTGVELSYAMSSFGKEYIYSAKQVKDGLPPPQKPIESKQEKKVMEEVHKEATKKEVGGQERGMWWKEVGENFRTGLFKKDEGNGAMLWRLYIAQMMASLEIEIKKGE